MGRFCLAYQNSFCTVCVERCPIPNAIVSARGIPRVDPALCDGCGLCVKLCPALEPAIRLFPRPPQAAEHLRTNPVAEPSRPRHLDPFLKQQEIA
jgi:Na+-translocating ferredoxin:NAD+ oxidoreductase RNF subunit RnfB